jgi:phytoene dehydrogenase-like protein
MTITKVNGNGTSNGNGTLMSYPTALTSPTPIASLSQSDRDTLLTLIAQMRELMPFLQDLTLEDRKSMAGMGTSNRAFAGTVLEVISQNNDFLPRSFSTEQLRADLETFDRLSTIVMALTQICNLVDATTIAIGTRAYEQSLVAYRHAKASGHGASLDDMMTGMKQRFTKKSRKSKATRSEQSMPSEESPSPTV